MPSKSGLLSVLLLGTLIFVAGCSILPYAVGGVPIQIPPPPYIPKCPEEDILIVVAYIEQGTPNILHLTVTFAAATPPHDQLLVIYVTQLQGSTEVVIGAYSNFGPPKTVHSFAVGLPEGNVDIALYAAVGTLQTDRWPNAGFQRITSLSGAAPNQFTDYDSVGGVVLPTNTFLVLTPYLTVIGLVATAAVAIKRKRVC
jgi:hypothetical protein